VDASQAVGTREMSGNKWQAPFALKSSLLHHRGRPLTTYDLGTVIIIIIIIIIGN